MTIEEAMARCRQRVDEVLDLVDRRDSTTLLQEEIDPDLLDELLANRRRRVHKTFKQHEAELRQWLLEEGALPRRR